MNLMVSWYSRPPNFAKPRKIFNREFPDILNPKFNTWSDAPRSGAQSIALRVHEGIPSIQLSWLLMPMRFLFSRRRFLNLSTRLRLGSLLMLMMLPDRQTGHLVQHFAHER